MADAYRSSAGDGLDERRLEWLVRQGKLPRHVAEWERGVFPADLARRAAGPGDDFLVPLGNVGLVAGALAAVVGARASMSPLTRGAVIVCALGLVAAVVARTTNPARRMGYGATFRVRTRGALEERTLPIGDGVESTFTVLRWSRPNGEIVHSVLATGVVDLVRAHGDGDLDVFGVERGGRILVSFVLPA